MMITETVKKHFLEGKTTKVIHLREMFSESEGTLLDKRTFRRWCREAGIELSKVDEQGNRTTRTKLSPALLKKFIDTHGNPFTN